MSQLWNVYEPVNPLARVRRGPYEHEFVNHVANVGVLAHNENTRAGSSAHQQFAEMARHGLPVMRDKNSFMLRRKREHFGIRNPFQLRLIRGQKIHGRPVLGAGNP